MGGDIVNNAFVTLLGGTFCMGSPPGVGYPQDGEGPSRDVTVSSFDLSRYAVTNAEFARFVLHTGYTTTAEKLGSSHVFHLLLSPAIKRATKDVPMQTPWWYPVEGASWQMPEGPGSRWAGRENHPVVHVSWYDAEAYCDWSNTRLPTEAQWEYAARAKSRDAYPWGSELTPEGKHMCNVWQGRFPGYNTAEDGFVGTAPVDAFEASVFGIWNMIGNVWEWCADAFTPDYHNTTSDRDPFHLDRDAERSVRGGSFLCHESYCNRYRLGARAGNAPNTTCSNLGFRVSSGKLV
jgi:formylglycine-generating enzyme required for sulfatase activity